MSRRADAGFTLIEAMVALAILGLTLVTLLAATSQALQAEGKATRYLEAVTLAEAKMNEITSLPLPTLLRLQEPVGGSFSGDLDGFRWTAAVRRVENAQNLYRAAVAVRWDEGQFDLETTLYRLTRIGAGQAAQ